MLMKKNGAVIPFALPLEEPERGQIAAAIDTPMRSDAFKLAPEEKIARIEHHFRGIMETLGLDLADDSLQGTPKRVAKMFVNEVFNGLDPGTKPEPTLFANKFGYKGMLVERGITVHSFCEHHFVPIIGKAAVAYFSSGQVIGLSKLDRIVKYYAARPQVQERLTEQIAAELKRVLRTEDVAVLIDAEHMCVKLRGVKDECSSTVTCHFSGRFDDAAVRSEFLTCVRN
ncbi:MAG: GTP cyclohydrolase I FolE [Flavobacteriales bacterium]|jgi:GTP cyclohydrolase I|nr:GTP cyclohydrolase I FolE [Flavobacteriales bacterium]